MSYSAAVEQWRPLVEQYFAPQDVDKALYVISLESGGNASAVGDGGASIGLFQLNDNGLGAGMGDSRYDPAANIAAAAGAVYGGQGWAPWGENNSYNGSVFGALGNNPYPGNTGAINGMAALGGSTVAEVYIGLSPGPSGGGMYFDPSSGLTWTADTGWYDAGPQTPYPTGGGGTGGNVPFDPSTPKWTGNGPQGYGTYYLDGPNGTPKTFIGVPTAPKTTTTGSGDNYTIETDPVSGRRYRANNGVFVSWMDPVSSGSSDTGLPKESYPGSGVTAQGVSIYAIPSSKSPTGYMLKDGRFINPDGSLYVAPNTGPEYKTVVSDGKDGFPPGTIYQVNTQTGQRSNIRYPSTSSSGGSSGGGSSGGGSYGGGGSTSSSVHSGGYNNVTTDIRSGGYNNTNTNINQSTSTNFNTSDIGPNTIANNAADRAQQAAQFAMTYGLNKTEAQRAAAKDYANLLMTVDPNAYQAFLAANGGGRLDNALLSGGNALSADAINPAAMALAAARGQEYNPATGATGGTGGDTGGAGGGLQPGTVGAGGGGTPPAGAPGTPAAALPADRTYEYWLANVYQPRAADTTGGGYYDANGQFVQVRGLNSVEDRNQTPTADVEDKQAMYQAWLAQQPPLPETPAEVPPAPTPGPYDQYGPPPTGYTSWEAWASDNPSYVQNAVNHYTPTATKDGVTPLDPVAIGAAQYANEQGRQQYWQSNPAAGAAAARTINQMAAGWPISTLRPEVRYARAMADVPGTAQWNNNLKPWEAGYQSMQRPGAYIGGGQDVPAAVGSPAYNGTNGGPSIPTGGAAAVPSSTWTPTNTGDVTNIGVGKTPPPAGWPIPAATGGGGAAVATPGWTASGAPPQTTNPAPKPQVQIAGGLPVNTTPLGPSTNPTTPLDPNAGSGFHAGDPNYRYDPATGTYVHLAYGGMTRAPMMVTGDPQRDGRPNPEIISNPTGAPISVMPMRNMGGLVRRPMMPMMRRMGGLPRFAYGTEGAYDKPMYDAPIGDGTLTQRELLYSTPPSSDVVQPTQNTSPATYTSTPQPVEPRTYSYAGDTQNTYIAPPAEATPPAPAPTQTTQTAPVTQPATDNTARADLIGNYSTAPGSAGQPEIGTAVTPPAGSPYSREVAPAPTPTGGGAGTEPSPLEQFNNPLFNEVLYTRLRATNPWMADPTAYMNVDYLRRDPVARRLYEQWLTMRYGIPEESIAFAQSLNRLGGASLASMGQGR